LSYKANNLSESASLNRSLVDVLCGRLAHLDKVELFREQRGQRQHRVVVRGPNIGGGNSRFVELFGGGLESVFMKPFRPKFAMKT
jgi:hypothetical protein